VNGGSLAEKAGLRVGDALIRVNTTDIFQLRHKEAQDTVARAGNNFELVVSRSVFKFNDYNNKKKNTHLFVAVVGPHDFIKNFPH
jgi:C-terminal processing protease CtpA/Prc